MDNALLAALHLAATCGAEVNDIHSLDLLDDHTNIGITWPGLAGMKRYVQGFGEGEDYITEQVVVDCLAVLRGERVDGKTVWGRPDA